MAESLPVMAFIAGWVMAAFMAYNDDVKAFYWGQRWLEPGRFTSQGNIMRRARLFIHSPELLALLSLAPTIVTALAILLVSIAYGEGIQPMVMFVFWFLIGRLASRLFRRSSNQKFSELLPVVVAKQVVRHCDPVAARQFLVELANSRAPEFREAACHGFLEMANEDGLHLLERMKARESGPVSVAADRLLPLARAAALGDAPARVSILKRLTDENKRWRNQLRITIFRRRQIKRNILQTVEAIEANLITQTAFRKSYPRIYCRKCLARAEAVESGKWRWVRCTVCMEAVSLVLNVRTVRGQIGGVKEWTLQDGLLLLPLWNVDNRTATGAEIDELEIVGGQDIPYDWAVNAVAEKLGAQGKPVKLILTDTPPLSANSFKILAANKIEAKK